MTDAELATARMEKIEAQIGAIDAKLDLILSKVDMVAKEVGPVIETLMESPMLKMLVGGKK